MMYDVWAIYPLVMTNIAIEHDPFIVEIPSKNGEFPLRNVKLPASAMSTMVAAMAPKTPTIPGDRQKVGKFNRRKLGKNGEKSGENCEKSGENGEKSGENGEKSGKNGKKIWGINLRLHVWLIFQKISMNIYGILVFFEF